MSNNFSSISRVRDAHSPRTSLESLPRYVERKIAARWKEWEPWVRIDLLRRERDPITASAEFVRLRRQHSQHLLALMRAGIAMRLVRRHRLDDPRITDELRMVLMRAAMERCRKARLSRHRTLRGSIIHSGATGDSLPRSESSKIDLAPRNIFPSQYRPVTLDLIQKGVSEHFHLRELRDQDLKVRSNRQIITFPRQIAMYIVRQLTTASLPEIGRQFGGMHHTTVLHSIKKIEQLRRSDERLNCTITRLMALQQQ